MLNRHEMNAAQLDLQKEFCNSLGNGKHISSLSECECICTVSKAAAGQGLYQDQAQDFYVWICVCRTQVTLVVLPKEIARSHDASL